MRAGGLIISGLLLTVSGCARTGVTMFAGEKGEAGAVAVLDPVTGKDLAVLDRPNSRTGIANGKPGAAVAISSDVAKRRYGDLLGDMPEQPKLFVLYFQEGSTNLVDTSTALIPELFQEMKRRPGVDIQIVGHTDTVGDATLNDNLSIKRAQQVQAMLVAMGMSPDILRATGRGEREPLEPTGDNVASVFNRRVEVFVK
jgi:outer membrane protein OmpA-like peptidoglycan-associated protein